ncbi:MAG: GatB/YqeY domain-containing protein [Candidatus Colwellbacteria bacterium]|nr:GatB/YqeY domain-containing protein [Candidatus Colwellbacteria bacterium]
MSLLQKLGEDLKENLKGRRESQTATLRMLLSAIHNREIEKRSKNGSLELSDEEVIEVLRKEAKKRREAADIYKKAGRSELARRENEELQFIQTYLPQLMSPGDIETVVDKVVAGGIKDFGLVMKAVMAEVKGKAEAGVVSKIVKAKLGA